LLRCHDRIGAGGGVELHTIQILSEGRIHRLEETPANLGLAASFQPEIGSGGLRVGNFLE
jgi:hypothetical protein